MAEHRGQLRINDNSRHLQVGELVGIPWLLALALRGDGWWLRSEIIWHKPNPMPESVKTRPTRCHEQVFLLAKSAKYFYDSEAVAEPAIWASDKRAGAGRIRYGGKRNGRKGTGRRVLSPSRRPATSERCGPLPCSIIQVLTSPFFRRSWLSRASWQGAGRGTSCLTHSTVQGRQE